MEIIAQIQLDTDMETKSALLETFMVCNKACNFISIYAWEKKIFGKIPLQKELYYEIKKHFSLSAQMTILCIRKVSDAYKKDRKKLRKFGLKGAITFDSRVLSRKDSFISIWTINGRKKLSIVCGEKQKQLLRSQEGESKLVLAKQKFYLHMPCEVTEETLLQQETFLGVDLGIVNIATDNDGTIFSGQKLETKRKSYFRLRKTLQKRGTPSSRRKLKRISKKESLFRRNVNHEISKKLVLKAKDTKRNIALENLKNIHRKLTVRKSQRAKHMSWSFGQLKNFILYKAKLYGVYVSFVNPKNTSRTCPVCKNIDKRNRKTRDKFICISCEYSAHADVVAAENVSARASVDTPIVATACS